VIRHLLLEQKVWDSNPKPINFPTHCQWLATTATSEVCALAKMGMGHSSQPKFGIIWVFSFSSGRHGVQILSWSNMLLVNDANNSTPLLTWSVSPGTKSRRWAPQSHTCYFIKFNTYKKKVSCHSLKYPYVLNNVIHESVYL